MWILSFKFVKDILQHYSIQFNLKSMLEIQMSSKFCMGKSGLNLTLLLAMPH